jgi:murein DD-endopeptidase MepM/ murein hydrolase activator NlpD
MTKFRVRIKTSLLPVVLALTLLPVRGQRIDFAWPTPNPAFRDGRPIEEFVQPTVSGLVTSGLFGCVRSEGTQFHEGLDLFPIARDAKGEATDRIYAVLPGVVRHVNGRAGDSSYGRYLVLEHPEYTPAIYTLYAHLSAFAPGIKAGDRIASGQVIGTMGRSAGGYSIPKERAHLHFEFGVRVTDDFQAWYDYRKFGSRNQHGVWNGMNLMGFDPLDFFERFRAREIDNFGDYFARMQPAVRVRIATSLVPDFVRRYPSLLTAQIPESGVGGWEVAFNLTGLPFAWTPLSSSEAASLKRNFPVVVEVDAQLVKAGRCRSLVISRRAGHVPGRDLETVLQQLFQLRP